MPQRRVRAEAPDPIRSGATACVGFDSVVCGGRRWACRGDYSAVGGSVIGVIRVIRFAGIGNRFGEGRVVASLSQSPVCWYLRAILDQALEPSSKVRALRPTPRQFSEQSGVNERDARIPHYPYLDSYLTW